MMPVLEGIKTENSMLSVLMQVGRSESNDKLLSVIYQISMVPIVEIIIFLRSNTTNYKFG
jgi:hypothetical protein